MRLQSMQMTHINIYIIGLCLPVRNILESSKYLKVLISILHVDLQQEVSFLGNVNQVLKEDLSEDQFQTFYFYNDEPCHWLGDYGHPDEFLPEFYLEEIVDFFNFVIRLDCEVIFIYLLG
jgi:hypothetical protein